ncbi:hypothetical protein U6A24_05465 [Aquimarina gracilis]|uniref:Uncharacterized protein n=1 Tax=Aquimarina gracilis TaxID=874422 RepID=A0ABU5ZTL9_9FLAO|nr:hypothetical protein [Aquimarina gracilis]MEB3344897.1 hypothetical protein [Aquimarina gracilis]
MQRFLFLIIFLISSSFIFGQKDVSDHKYVIVPKGYVFLGEEDAYQLNSLTKFLFNKYGFTTFMEGEELPEDLVNNGCMALRADVVKNPGLFVTKLVVQLKDCSNTLVFSSSEGTSREKEFKKAYHEALRNAFKEVQKLNYKYNESAKKDVATTPKKQGDVTSNETEKNITAGVEDKSTKNNGFSFTEKTLLYTFNSSVFTIKKQEYGFELLENQGDELVLKGKIYSLKKQNMYLVTAGDLSGVGYFDSYGNFLLERVNPVTNKVILDTFARQ